MLRPRFHHALIRAAKHYGYTDIDPVFVTQEHLVCTAALDGRVVVLKGSTARDQFDQLENEVIANEFLRKITPHDARFVFPRSSVLENGTAGFLFERELFPGTPLAHKDPHELCIPDGQEPEILEAVLQLLVFLHQIPVESVPRHFHKRMEREFAPERYLKRQREHLQDAQNNGVVTEDEAKQLLGIVEETPWSRQFCHHDIEYSNLVPLPDGRLGVLDAEYARLGMRYYDIAYLFLNSEILHGDTELARRQLRFNTGGFLSETEEYIPEEIFVPLAYRLSAILMLVGRSGFKQKIDRAQRVLDCVLEQDYATLIRS